MGEGRLAPVLMFEGRAQEALDLYLAVFTDARLDHVERFGPTGEPSDEGSLRAVLLLGDRPLVLQDSPVHHAFSFTPSVSLSVRCRDRAEIERVVAALGEGGRTLMPLGAYPFAEAFAWVDDRFGVSWQLTLAE